MFDLIICADLDLSDSVPMEPNFTEEHAAAERSHDDAMRDIIEEEGNYIFSLQEDMDGLWSQPKPSPQYTVFRFQVTDPEHAHALYEALHDTGHDQGRFIEVGGYCCYMTTFTQFVQFDIERILALSEVLIEAGYKDPFHQIFEIMQARKELDMAALSLH